MNNLRILSLAFLSACVCTAAFAQTFNATSGSMVIHPGDQGVPFTVAGPGFSASGDIVGPDDNPLDSPYFPGLTSSLLITGDSASGFFDMSLTVRGVPWSYPVGTTADGEAIARFLIPDLVLTHPGIFSFPVDFDGSFRGTPASVAPPPGLRRHHVYYVGFFRRWHRHARCGSRPKLSGAFGHHSGELHLQGP